MLTWLEDWPSCTYGFCPWWNFVGLLLSWVGVWFAGIPVFFRYLRWKGYDPERWRFMVVCTSWLGLIRCVFMLVDNPMRNIQQCPYCTMYVPRAATHRPYCTQSLARRA